MSYLIILGTNKNRPRKSFYVRKDLTACVEYLIWYREDTSLQRVTEEIDVDRLTAMHDIANEVIVDGRREVEEILHGREVDDLTADELEYVLGLCELITRAAVLRYRACEAVG